MNIPVFEEEDYELITYRFCCEIMEESIIVPADICRLIAQFVMNICVTVSCTLLFPTDRVYFHVPKRTIMKGLIKLREEWEQFECYQKDGFIYPDEYNVDEVPLTNYSEFRRLYGEDGSPAPYKHFCYHAHSVAEFSVPICVRFETWQPYGQFDVFKLRFVLYHQHEEPKTPYIYFGIEYSKHRSTDYLFDCDKAKDAGLWEDPCLHGISAPLLVRMKWGNLTQIKLYPYYHETNQKLCQEQRMYNKLDIFERNIREMDDDFMRISMQIYNALSYYTDGDSEQEENYGYYSALNDIEMDYDSVLDEDDASTE